MHLMEIFWNAACYRLKVQLTYNWTKYCNACNIYTHSVCVCVCVCSCVCLCVCVCECVCACMCVCVRAYNELGGAYIMYLAQSHIRRFNIVMCFTNKIC